LVAESNRAFEARMEPSAAKRKPRVGVVLLNLGGPEWIQDVGGQQAQDLQSSLRLHGVDATSYVAMRYWHPFTESAVADIKANLQPPANPLHP
jgi:protoheme ferro-lyase